MNRPILTLFTGTPTARADAALPPTAKIQLPIRVRVRIQVAMATNRSHHTTVILTVTLPMSKEDAKIALALSKPSMSETFLVATEPVSSFVTPRFAPCRMKNVPSVIRKLGIPVLCTRIPVEEPDEQGQQQRDEHAEPHVDRAAGSTSARPSARR